MIHKAITLLLLIFTASLMYSQELPDSSINPPDEIPLELRILPTDSTTIPEVSIDMPDTVPAQVNDIRGIEVIVDRSDLPDEANYSDYQSMGLRSAFVSNLDVDNNDDFSSFSILDSILEDYRVFFIGENHVFRHSNQQLQLKMFRYLYYNAGVRTLLLEFGYSSGWLMNKYIQSGDTALYQIFDDYAYKAWAEFVMNLAEFNLSLDSNDRIEVIGIDVERFKTIPLKVLALQIPEDKPIPSEISLSVESLISLVRYLDKQAKDDEQEDYFFSYQTYDVSNHVNLFVEEYDSLRSYYKEYLDPEAFIVFDSTMVSLKHHLIYEDYKDKRLAQGFIYRERYMYDQFTRVLHQNPEGKFFAQFGRCHVGKVLQEEACTWHNFNSVAKRINTSPDTTINGMVCSIGTFYPNSESYEDESDEIDRLDDIVAMAGDDGLTLIGMAEGNEVFDQLRGMYQFVIINQNTPADEMEAEEDDMWDGLVEELSPSGAFRIGLGYTLRRTDFRQLNTAISLYPGASSFITENTELSADFGYNSNGFFTLLGYRQMLPQKILNGDLEVMRLGRWGAYYSLGVGNLERRVGFSAQANFAYERMNLSIDESNNPSAVGTSLFGDPLKSAYHRNAFTIGGQIGYHVNLLKVVPIELFAGYNLDVTSPKWTQQKLVAENSPDTRLDGFYAGVALIFLIPE